MQRNGAVLGILAALLALGATAQTTTNGNRSATGEKAPTGVIPAAVAGTPGSDAGVLIRACLEAAIASGTDVCDARSLTGTRYQLASNMAEGITQPVQLLLAPGTIFATLATQVLPAGFVITVANGGSSTGIAYPGAPAVDFDWTGARGGRVFDLADSPNSKLEGLLIDCNHSASVGVNLSGGILDAFGFRLENTTVQNCTAGNGVGIDNYDPASFPVTLSSRSGKVTGQLTSGSFPAIWVGKTSSHTFAIAEASREGFDTPVPARITVTITGADTFSASAPQGRWSPPEGAGVRGTLESHSEAQEWSCINCQIAGNRIGYTTASAGARFWGSDVAANSRYGIELFGSGQFSASDGVFTQNGTDIYIGSSGVNTLAQTTNVWFENSTVGVLGAASGVSGYTVDFTNSNLHSSSPSGLVDVSAAGAGTVNFVADTINPLTRNASIRGNDAATANVGAWSLGGITTPTVSGFGSHANAAVSGTTITASTEFSGPGTGLTGTAPLLSVGGNAGNLSGTPALPDGVTATTQSAGDASAKLATDAFVADAVATLGAKGAAASPDASRMSAAQTMVRCTVSGKAYFSEPEQGASFKEVVVNLDGCAGTAKYVYPVAYHLAPGAVGPLAGLAGTPGRTAVTVTAGSSTTGVLVLVGF